MTGMVWGVLNQHQPCDTSRLLHKCSYTSRKSLTSGLEEAPQRTSTLTSVIDLLIIITDRGVNVSSVHGLEANRSPWASSDVPIWSSGPLCRCWSGRKQGDTGRDKMVITSLQEGCMFSPGPPAPQTVLRDTCSPVSGWRPKITLKEKRNRRRSKGKINGPQHLKNDKTTAMKANLLITGQTCWSPIL